ncbi:MAG: GAF domain-containing protein [Blastococcus sp.]
MPPPDTVESAEGGASEGRPVLAAVLAAVSGSQLEATLHDIVEAAARHVDAGYGAMGVLSPDGRRLDRFVIVGMGPEEIARIEGLPTGHGILGLLVAVPEALRLDDMSGHAASTGFPPGHPPMRSFLGVPVRVGDAVFGNLYLTEKRTGGPFTPADIEIAQALAAVAGLAIENARLAERAENRRRWGLAATEMATALLSGADPDEVLQSVSTRVSALTAADRCGVLAPILDDDGSLTIVAGVGSGAADVEGVRIPLAGTDLGETYDAGESRLIDDISTMPVLGRRAAVVVELTVGFGPALVVPFGNPPDRSLLVAMRASGSEPFDEDDLDLMSAFAAQAAVVLELAHAQQRERRLQVQTDRDRIARDLHDHVVQRIFATALSLDRLSRSLEQEQPDAAGRLARSVDELDETMAEIRAAIFELQQQDGLETSTVHRRLAEVVRQATEGHALQPDVRFRGPVDELPRHLVPDLLAVVRELVTNVVRHARATRVTVLVEAGDADVSVTVTDDGGGLPAVTPRSGLANLADRAERRGGRLTTSSGGSGTEVCWTAPHGVGR